jgi:hypothetical protein
VFCSAVFFVATNFAVWLFGDIYPSTAAGLLACYASGLPFLKYAIAGDLFWSGILFGGYQLAILGSREARPIGRLQGVPQFRG